MLGVSNPLELTMTREIKFRVWNRHSKRMIEHNELRGLHFDTVLCAENLMQYTGLKDINGKEIYEGDILKKNEDILEVIWGRQRAGWRGKVIKRSNYGWKIMENIFKVEVIGNIYENPELLTYRDL